MPGLRMLEPRRSQVAQLLGGNVGNPGASQKQKGQGATDGAVLLSCPAFRIPNILAKPPVRLVAHRAVSNQLSFDLPPADPHHEAAAGPNVTTKNPPYKLLSSHGERYKWFEW